MENIQENYIKNIGNIIDEADRMNISNFTYELFDCIYSDIVDENVAEFGQSTVEAYVNEIRNSLEIMNPDLIDDIIMLEKVLIQLENILEIG